MFIVPYIYLRVLAVVFIVSLVLSFFKIKVKPKSIHNLEFLFLGLGHALNRSPFKAFGFFLISSFYQVLVFNNVKSYLHTLWVEHNYIVFGIIVLLVFSLLLCITKTSRDSVYSKYAKPKGKWYGSSDRDTIRDHMEYHHHDSHMP